MDEVDVHEVKDLTEAIVVKDCFAKKPQTELTFHCAIQNAVYQSSSMSGSGSGLTMFSKVTGLPSRYGGRLAKKGALALAMAKNSGEL